MRPASLGFFIHYSGIRQTQLITVPGLIALPVLALLGLPEHCLTIKGTTLPKRFKSTANEMHFHCHQPIPLALSEWPVERCTSVGSSSSPPFQQLITRAEWERCLCFRFRWRRWWTAFFCFSFLLFWLLPLARFFVVPASVSTFILNSSLKWQKFVRWVSFELLSTLCWFTVFKFVYLNCL